MRPTALLPTRTRTPSLHRRYEKCASWSSSRRTCCRLVSGTMLESVSSQQYPDGAIAVAAAAAVLK